MAASFSSIANLSLGSLDVRDRVHLTAIHEAGHCTAHWRMFHKILRVSAAAAEGHAGITDLGRRESTSAEEAQGAVAGPVAEAMAVLAADPYPGDTESEFKNAWEEEITEAVLYGGGGDLRVLAELFGGKEDAEEFFGWHETAVREMLTEFWPQLIALAEAIVAHPRLTLTGHDVVTVLNAALPADRWMLQKRARHRVVTGSPAC